MAVVAPESTYFAAKQMPLSYEVDAASCYIYDFAGIHIRHMMQT